MRRYILFCCLVVLAVVGPLLPLRPRSPRSARRALVCFASRPAPKRARQRVHASPVARSPLLMVANCAHPAVKVKRTYVGVEHAV